MFKTALSITEGTWDNSEMPESFDTVEAFFCCVKTVLSITEGTWDNSEMPEYFDTE